MFEKIQTEISDRTQAEASFRKEQAKANRLLLNILPAAIAAQLKENELNQGAIANCFETSTVLFADILCPLPTYYALCRHTMLFADIREH